MRLLRGLGGINVNYQGSGANFCTTPLSYTSRGSYTLVVSLLITEVTADPNVCNTSAWICK